MISVVSWKTCSQSQPLLANFSTWKRKNEIDRVFHKCSQHNCMFVNDVDPIRYRAIADTENKGSKGFKFAIYSRGNYYYVNYRVH